MPFDTHLVGLGFSTGAMNVEFVALNRVFFVGFSKRQKYYYRILFNFVPQHVDIFNSMFRLLRSENKACRDCFFSL